MLLSELSVTQMYEEENKIFLFFDITEICVRLLILCKCVCVLLLHMDGYMLLQACE